MIATLLLSAFIYANAPDEQYDFELTEYVKDFLTPVNQTKSYPKRFDEAQAMIPIILKYCKQYNVDPLRVAVLIGLESSWRQDVEGELCEMGPMQIMPKWFRKVFDLESLDGQIHAGIYHLSESLAQCNQDGAAAYNYYASNRCGEPPSAKSRWREKRYQQAVKKYRRERIKQ